MRTNQHDQRQHYPMQTARDLGRLDHGSEEVVTIKDYLKKEEPKSSTT